MRNQVFYLIISILVFGTGFYKCEKKQNPIPVKSMDLKQLTQKNAEIFSEMNQVIFQARPSEAGAFYNWVDTLNQGASYEGVYRALTLSDHYRNLEKNTPAAQKNTIRIFVDEVLWIQRSFKNSRFFTEDDAKPPQGGSLEENNTVLSFEKPTTPSNMKDFYLKWFQNVSIFTLKRLWGEVVLLKLEELKSAPQELAEWYGLFVDHLFQYHVNFGLELRNKKDLQFHQQWALHSDFKTLQWEVLNRIHRVINNVENEARQTNHHGE